MPMNTELVIKVVNYIIEHKTSCKDTAEVFGIGVTTVSDYCNKYMKKIDYDLYLQVKEVLKNNYEERYSRQKEKKQLRIKKDIDKMVQDKFKELGIVYEED